MSKNQMKINQKKRKIALYDQQYKLNEIQCDQIQINSQNIQNFHKSLQNLYDFIEQIGQKCQYDIRKDVREHIYDSNKTKQLIGNKIDKYKILEFANQRVQKMKKMKKIKKNWCQQDLKLLIWIISKYADKQSFKDLSCITSQHWDAIVSMIPGCTKQQCFYKWLNLKNIRLSTNKWSDYQSQLLKYIVTLQPQYQKGIQIDWKQVSKQLYEQNQQLNKIFRSSKLCKQHWGNFLKPQLKKGPWQIQQDIKLLQLVYEKGGKRKWTELASKFNGRTQNSIKNRFNLLIEKQKKHSKSKQLLSMIQDCIKMKQNMLEQTNIFTNNQDDDEFLNQIIPFEYVNPMMKNDLQEFCFCKQQQNKDNMDSNILKSTEQIITMPMKVEIIKLQPTQFIKLFKYYGNQMKDGMLLKGQFFPKS